MAIAELQLAWPATRERRKRYTCHGHWRLVQRHAADFADGIPHPSSYIEISHCPAVAVPLDFGCRAHICYIYVASGYRTDNRELRSERQGRGSPRAPRPPGARASSVFSVLPLRQTGEWREQQSLQSWVLPSALSRRSVRYTLPIGLPDRVLLPGRGPAHLIITTDVRRGEETLKDTDTRESRA